MAVTAIWRLYLATYPAQTSLRAQDIVWLRHLAPDIKEYRYVVTTIGVQAARRTTGKISELTNPPIFPGVYTLLELCSLKVGGAERSR